MSRSARCSSSRCFVGVVWGITAIADPAQFSTAITELSPPAYVGTALTTQPCVGFALTMVSIWLVPPVVRVVGWSWAFAILALGPLFGVISMARLRPTRASPSSTSSKAGTIRGVAIPRSITSRP